MCRRPAPRTSSDGARPGLEEFPLATRDFKRGGTKSKTHVGVAGFQPYNTNGEIARTALRNRLEEIEVPGKSRQECRQASKSV
jgi:hypothetical protein